MVQVLFSNRFFRGSGYTFGTISNAQIVSAGATNLVGAELDVIIPPKGRTRI